MSGIGNLLAPAASVAAHNTPQQAVQTARADATNTNANQIAQNAVQNSAAVVTLTTVSANRAPSRGNQRASDGAFEKQRQSGQDKEKKAEAQGKKTVNVSA